MSDPRPDNWFFFLLEPKPINLDLDTYGDPGRTVEWVEKVYTNLFALYLSYKADEIFPPAAREGADSIVRGEAFYDVNRIEIVYVMAKMSIGILAFILPVVAWAYIQLYHGFLCHPPTSLAMIYATMYASNALEDVAGTEKMSSREQEQRLLSTGYRYGYGWLIGRDGRPHFGIEREPLLPKSSDGEDVESIGEGAPDGVL